jgi:hypothetical protein
MRPGDWQVLDLDRDPTPGEPFAVRSLAARVLDLGQDAAAAERDVRSLAGDGAVLSWVGLAGGALDDFPTQLTKLADSYEQAGQALSGWAQALGGAQDQADRALELGRLDMADELDASADDIAAGIHDAVRYTVVAEDARYADATLDTLRRMQDDGFQTVKEAKFNWGPDAGYKGTNSTWRDPQTGQTFEVQIHTPDSLAAKEATHPLYKQARILLEGSAQRLAIEARQAEIFRQVSRPPGTAELASRSRGGTP